MEWSAHLPLVGGGGVSTLGALKNVKFRLSWNSTKFDVVARFYEKISTVKSVLSSEI